MANCNQFKKLPLCSSVVIGGQKIIIMTFNVGNSPNDQCGEALQILRGMNPDIIFLQRFRNVNIIHLQGYRFLRQQNMLDTGIYVKEITFRAADEVIIEEPRYGHPLVLSTTVELTTDQGYNLIAMSVRGQHQGRSVQEKTDYFLNSVILPVKRAYRYKPILIGGSFNVDISEFINMHTEFKLEYTTNLQGIRTRNFDYFMTYNDGCQLIDINRMMEHLHVNAEQELEDEPLHGDPPQPAQPEEVQEPQQPVA